MPRIRLRFLALSLLMLAGAWWLWRTGTNPAPVSPSDPAPAPVTTSTRSATAPTAAARPIMPPTDLQRTIVANLVPGRMLFLDVAIDAAGLKLVGANGAAGRAKPAPVREGAGFIVYEVFDSAGRLALTGSVEDPTWRRIEFPASSDDGRIGSVVQASAGGAFAVRLPGESDAVRVVFYRTAAEGSPAAREPLGEFVLR